MSLSFVTRNGLAMRDWVWVQISPSHFIKRAAGVTKSDAFITDVHKATPVRVSLAAKPLAIKYDFFCIRRHICTVAISHIVLLHNEPEIFIARDRIIDRPSALTPFP